MLGMVEPLSEGDVAAAGGVLARAFRDNPGTLAVLKGDNPDVRLRIMQRSVTDFTDVVRRYGAAEVIKEGGKVTAVALCFGPKQFPPPLWAQLLISRGPLLAGPARTLRFARMDFEMRKRHPHYPHWYLWFLGVEPERQGKGLGSELLRSLGAKAEADRVPCYLETDKATSVRLYERHGYVVQSEEVLGGLDLNMWFMKRDLP